MVPYSIPSITMATIGAGGSYCFTNINACQVSPGPPHHSWAIKTSGLVLGFPKFQGMNNHHFPIERQYIFGVTV